LPVWMFLEVPAAINVCALDINARPSIASWQRHRRRALNQTRWQLLVAAVHANRAPEGRQLEEESAVHGLIMQATAVRQRQRPSRLRPHVVWPGLMGLGSAGLAG
jgi:hypothetical protein